jgi:hypothetical protein
VALCAAPWAKATAGRTANVNAGTSKCLIMLVSALCSRLRPSVGEPSLGTPPDGRSRRGGRTVKVQSGLDFYLLVRNLMIFLKQSASVIREARFNAPPQRVVPSLNVLEVATPRTVVPQFEFQPSSRMAQP